MLFYKKSNTPSNKYRILGVLHPLLLTVSKRCQENDEHTIARMLISSLEAIIDA